MVGKYCHDKMFELLDAAFTNKPSPFLMDHDIIFAICFLLMGAIFLWILANIETK